MHIEAKLSLLKFYDANPKKFLKKDVFGFWDNRFLSELKFEKKKKEKEKEITTIQKCKIIEYLANEFGGNAHDKGIVKVTASSIYNNLYRAKKVVDFNNDKYFYSKNEKNSWLMYDFINRKVLPTRYLITTANWNCDMPRNWVIEGSNNNEEWDVLDSRQNDVSLKEVNVTGKFIIESQEKSYRYLRIRQTGLNSGNNAVLAFSSLEFIGTLSQNE